NLLYGYEFRRTKNDISSTTYLARKYIIKQKRPVSMNTAITGFKKGNWNKWDKETAATRLNKHSAVKSRISGNCFRWNSRKAPIPSTAAVANASNRGPE